MTSHVRINKLLSQLGVASRRKADDLIAKGKVSLNGKVLTAPGALVDTAKDKIEVSGKTLDLTQKKRLYYLVNKPKGHICTVEDTHARRTILDLLPSSKGLFPVGRLDKDTTGLIIITDDGELAHRLMHPSYEIRKTYEAVVSGLLKTSDIAKLEKGIDIGEKTPAVSKIIKVNSLKGRTVVILEIHEGKKRQIRRVFEALGYSVKDLKRIDYAGLKIDMKEGGFRSLTEKEINYLRKKVGLL
ncbi:MAG: rRNA pseudouridine synthase [Candidatus Omnitrophica bacterium]|nr:rRNA pseudouridine synthase [Candidatus Omnitrophota bacterium]